MARSDCPMCRATVTVDQLTVPPVAPPPPLPPPQQAPPTVSVDPPSSSSCGSQQRQREKDGDSSGSGSGSGSGSVATSALEAIQPLVLRSKMNRLIAELVSLRDTGNANTQAKALVFSQFNSTLDQLQLLLKQKGFT